MGRAWHSRGPFQLTAEIIRTVIQITFAVSKSTYSGARCKPGDTIHRAWLLPPRTTWEPSEGKPRRLSLSLCPVLLLCARFFVRGARASTVPESPGDDAAITAVCSAAR